MLAGAVAWVVFLGFPAGRLGPAFTLRLNIAARRAPWTTAQKINDFAGPRPSDEIRAATLGSETGVSFDEFVRGEGCAAVSTELAAVRPRHRRYRREYLVDRPAAEGAATSPIVSDGAEVHAADPVDIESRSCPHPRPASRECSVVRNRAPAFDELLSAGVDRSWRRSWLPGVRRTAAPSSRQGVWPLESGRALVATLRDAMPSRG